MSVNAEIWRHSPKVSWGAEHSVYVVTCMAVIGFNSGAKEVCSIQRHLGIRIGKSSAVHAQRKDRERIESTKSKRAVKPHKWMPPEEYENQKGKVVRVTKGALDAVTARGRGRSPGRGRGRGRGTEYQPGGH